MELLVCLYPMYLTHQYYSNQSETVNLPFLAVWWSTFGTISLAENYANINHLPFYWILKSSVLLSLYSSDYRKWLTENALSTVAVAGDSLKKGIIKITQEHFPKMLTTEHVEKSEKTKVSNTIDWFSSWVYSKSE
jgi:hypothetical protein